MLFRIFTAFSSISVLVCLAAAIYMVLLAVIAFVPWRQTPIIHSSKKSRFAVIIAAHNEEPVICEIIQSLKRLSYPKQFFDIFVIADNCTDSTARVARREGAKVYERFHPTKRSKGFALHWFFEIFLERSGHQYDAAVIFDADNIVDSEFLTVMNDHLQSGERVLCGYRDNKNAKENVVAAISGLFWLQQMRIMNLPRTRLGLSVTSVGGTGFCFNLDVIRKIGWNTVSMTEDIEFTMQMIVRQIGVVYVPEAKFLDEQTPELVTSLVQRYRWSVGAVQTIKATMPNLVCSFFAGNVKALDAIWFLIQVPFYFFAMILGIIRNIAQVSFYLDDPLLLSPTITYGLVMYGLIVLAAFLVIWRERQSLAHYWLAALLYPIALAVWGAIQMMAVLKPRTKWHKIEHRSLSVTNKTES